MQTQTEVIKRLVTTYTNAANVAKLTSDLSAVWGKAMADGNRKEAAPSASFKKEAVQFKAAVVGELPPTPKGQLLVMLIRLDKTIGEVASKAGFDLVQFPKIDVSGIDDKGDETAGE